MRVTDRQTDGRESVDDESESDGSSSFLLLLQQGMPASVCERASERL